MTPGVAKARSLEAGMTREESSNLILAFARVLFVNGESTQQTLAAAERVGNYLGFRTTVLLRWGELEVHTEDSKGRVMSASEGAPSSVNMNRVTSTRRTIEELCDGLLCPASAIEAINRIAKAPPAPT